MPAGLGDRWRQSRWSARSFFESHGARHLLVALLQGQDRHGRRRHPHRRQRGPPPGLRRAWPTRSRPTRSTSCPTSGSATTRSTTSSSSAPASGTDVALALSKGAKHIDAVEIDPRIHADRRGDEPRPAVRRPAGRPSTSTTAAPSSSARDKQYDLIIFALPDSLTLVAGASPAAARELPVHRAVPRGGCRSTSSPAAPSRCTTTTARTGWSAGSATPRPRRSATTRASTC